MIYAVGDIHGCYFNLQDALDYLESVLNDDEDRVVFLGDYMDRGKDSKRVIETLIEWKSRHPRTVFLRGNHEDLILYAREDENSIGESAYYQSAEFQIWLWNGGFRTMASYGAEADDIIKTIPREHWEFIESTENEFRSGGYRFVHAGVSPEGIAWNDGPRREPSRWIRDDFINSKQDFSEIIVFGHTCQKTFKPLIMSNKIGLDTMPFRNGKLTVAKFDPASTGGDRLKFEYEQF